MERDGTSLGQIQSDNEIWGNCMICEKIHAILEKKLDGHVNETIGLVDDLVTIECPQHKYLFDWLSQELKFNERRGRLTMFRDTFSASTHFWHQPADENNYDFGYEAAPIGVEMNEENGSFGFALRLDPEWINSEKLRQWYLDCCTKHKSCSNPDFLTQIPAPKPQFFIDTSKMCLVPALQNTSFVALSYVWGQTETLKNMEANVSKLQEPGALNDTSLQPRIPKTIRHAIHLLPLLGERYLWVDTLCITQDNEIMFQDQISRMGSIFAHASAVIVAIDGLDADHGLHGLKDVPNEEPRHVEQFMMPFGNKNLIKRIKLGQPIRPDPSDRGYFQRGWTFQEYLFARRRICFQNESVWFECCKFKQFEDHAHSELPWNTRDWTFDVGYPALNVYSSLVEEFNVRQFRYGQDCLSAFSGLLSCYTKPFKGGFLCGLPEMFFDATLLWQPVGELQRRVPTANLQDSIGIEYCLPSWSWVGWSGEIDFQGWATGNDWVASCRGRIGSSRCQIFPMTTWFTADSPDATERRQIDVEWFKWRELYQDVTRELPPGWSRRQKESNESLTIEHYPSGYGKYIYEHKSCSATFWYPIPLSDPDPQPTPTPPTRYLFASLQTCQLHTLGNPFTREYHLFGTGERTMNNFISLSDSQQQWIGILQLHDIQSFEKQAQKSVGARAALQLIAISRGAIPNDLEYGELDIEEYEFDERPKEDKYYEYVNVMWITWEKEFARREAVGRVYKPAWDSLKPTVIDVVLG